jgi:hypothetical protein
MQARRERMPDMSALGDDQAWVVFCRDEPARGMGDGMSELTGMAVTEMSTMGISFPSGVARGGE